MIIPLLTFVGFKVTDSYTKVETHQLQDGFRSVEEIYESSDNIFVGRFIGAEEPELIDVSGGEGTTFAKYVFYNFKVQKVLKGEVQEKIIQVPFRYSYIDADGSESKSGNKEYKLNKKMVIFTDKVVDGGRAEDKNQVAYIIKNTMQAVVEFEGNDTVEINGEETPILDTEEKVIYKEYKTLGKLINKINKLKSK